MPEKADFHQRILDVLQTSPVFSRLDSHVLHEMAEVMELQSASGGNMVLREGDPSDSMLFLISGRLRVSRRDRDGSLLLYNEILPGESIGEVGMILQQSRTADVTAVRDSVYAVLNRANFEILLQRQPLALNRVFVQAIYNHLRHTAKVTEKHTAQTFVVVPLVLDGGTQEVARSLAQSFAKMGSVRHVPPDEGTQAGDTLLNFDELESQFDFLIYEAEPGNSDWTRRAFRQADQMIFVSRAGAAPALGELEQQLSREPGFSMKRKHMVVLHDAQLGKPEGTSPWKAGREVERVYPVRQGNAADHARLARFLTGNAVGVVLGGGGARGFAHLGVLRALHECGIPVDLVGGNSMGALIGAQYCYGWSLDEIREQTQLFAKGGERLTLPLISLVSGRRVERDLRKMFGEVTVDGMWLPYFAAACNLTKGCTTVQDAGPLWRAVLASNSPAGLFPPVLQQGELLVDGAILENVPVDAMRMRLGTPLEKRRGNGTIIAIDVDVREDLGADPNLMRLSVWSTIKGYFSPDSHPSPGIGDILYRAGHIGGLNQRGRTIAQADHYLEPPVGEFSLMGYRHAQDIADVGYRYAMEKIRQWDPQTLPR
jgi:NTE family protein/lysophospholipid hydrolase